MLGVYTDTMAWDIGAAHSDLNLVDPQRANLKVHFEICPLRATSPDTLTQIEI